MNPAIRLLISALRDAFQIVGIGYTVFIVAQIARDSLQFSIRETFLVLLAVVIGLALVIAVLENRFASEGKTAEKGVQPHGTDDTRQGQK